MSINSKDLILFFSEQINELRRNPSQFGKLLHKRLTLFKDDFTYERSDMPSILYKTQEGKKAVKQALQYLQNIEEKLNPLVLSVQLCEIAYHVCLQMSKQSRVDDPSHFKKQIKQAIKNSHCIIQNLELVIEYGFRKDYEVIPTILVDDGNATRSRRHSLLTPSNRLMGIAVQEHSQYDFVVLILLTDYIIVEHEVQDQSPQCSCSLM